MVTTTPNDLTSSSPTQTETIAVLPGFYTEREAAKNLLFLNVVNGPKTLEEIHAIWEQTSKECAQLQRRAYSPPPIDTLPAEWQYYEQELKSRARFSCCLPRVEHRIRKVPIQFLLTPQWYVNRNHVENLTQHAPAPDPSDWEEVLHFVFPPEPVLPNPNQNGDGLFFPPHAQNMHTTLTPVQRGAAHEYISTLRMHAAPGYLQVAKVGNRLVVVNGIHRICALWQRGWRKVPCLLREAQNLSELGFPPGQLGVLPEQSILHQSRPPYVIDLLEDTLTRSFQQPPDANMRISVQRVRVSSQM